MWVELGFSISGFTRNVSLQPIIKCTVLSKQVYSTENYVAIKSEVPLHTVE